MNSLELKYGCNPDQKPSRIYMADGSDLPVTVLNGKCVLTGTDTIAGSSIHLLDGVRRAVSFGVPLETAVTAATLTPAKVIGRADEIGSLAVGKCADRVVLDQELNLKAGYIDGKRISGGEREEAPQ